MPGGYMSMGQQGVYANPSVPGDQSSRPMSPPGLPRGPSQSLTQSQRSQVRSPGTGYLGPQMIRPATAAHPAAQMAGNQMAVTHMAGNQLVGNAMLRQQTAGSPKSPNSLRAAGLAMPRAASGGSPMAIAQPQPGQQPSNSGASRPNSASSQEGSGSAGQLHGALVPQSRSMSGASDQSQQQQRQLQQQHLQQQQQQQQQADVRLQPGKGSMQFQRPGFGASPYSMGWNGSMPAAPGAFASMQQAARMQGGTCLFAALDHCPRTVFWVQNLPV